MALFNAQDGGGQAVTLIGAEAYFHGLLTVKGSLRIEGVVEGDISDAVSVEIGKNGRVKGNIVTETLSIAGEVSGDVIASRSIELLASGRLNGKIRTAKLRIEDGAIFEGQCLMSSDDKQGELPKKVRSETDFLLRPSAKLT